MPAGLLIRSMVMIRMPRINRNRGEPPEENIQPDWSIEDLLARDGFFRLDDVSLITGISPHILKACVEGYKHASGIMKCPRFYGSTHWLVNMKLFRKFYPDLVKMRPVRTVDPKWDANQLLNQKGTFYLAQVVRKLPLTAEQVIYHANKTSGDMPITGVWRGDTGYLIDMPTFAQWVKRFWLDQKK